MNKTQTASAIQMTVVDLAKALMACTGAVAVTVTDGAKTATVTQKGGGA